MECLIVVDIQYDFLPGGALAVPDGDLTIPVINYLQKDFPLVVATQDWHPEGHKSFASSHVGRSVLEVIDYRGMEQVLWPDHCVQGTEGAELSVALQTERIEAIFRKGTDPEIDSYSGFFDNGKLKSTGLHGFLQDKGISKISVCGLAADFCVYFTAMHALDLGYEVTILNNASRPIDPVAYELKTNQFMSKGGVIKE